MTQQEFDNYRFSIKTVVLYDNEWCRLEEVNFEEMAVRLINGQRLTYDKIEVIDEDL